MRGCELSTLGKQHLKRLPARQARVLLGVQRVHESRMLCVNGRAVPGKVAVTAASMGIEASCFAVNPAALTVSRRDATQLCLPPCHWMQAGLSRNMHNSCRSREGMPV